MATPTPGALAWRNVARCPRLPAQFDAARCRQPALAAIEFPGGFVQILPSKIYQPAPARSGPSGIWHPSFAIYLGMRQIHAAMELTGIILPFRRIGRAIRSQIDRGFTS